MATSHGPSARRPGLLKIILGAIVLVVVAVGADWWQANREMDALLEEVEGSEQQVAAAVENLEYTVRFSRLAGLEATAPQEARDAAMVDVSRRLAVACARAAKAMQESGAQVQSVRILPWHRSLLDARTAYLERSRAWQDLFVAGAGDPSRLVDPVLGDRVTATSTTSRTQLDDARPTWARHDATGRIDRIFSEAAEPFS